jgi:Flp pilus assembly protein TadB
MPVVLPQRRGAHGSTRLRTTRRGVLAIDAGLGVIAALAAVLLLPGLALVAIGALLVTAACLLPFAIRRWRARRSRFR